MNKSSVITPSAAVAPLRRLSRSSSEPRCTSAPAAASDLALASERARPRTWCPASINSRTIAEPMNPVAPVTKTRMLNLLLRMNADDRLSLDPFGPVEGGDGIVEGSHVTDVCPQPTIPGPLDNVTQLGAIGYDDEIDSQAVSGPCLGWAGDGHQRSSGANHARRPLRDVAAEDIENQIDLADIF